MKTNNNVIYSDRDIMGGTPVFRGTRVPIKNLIDYLEAGDSLDTFLDHFPSVKRQDAISVLSSIVPRELVKVDNYEIMRSPYCPESHYPSY